MLYFEIFQGRDSMERYRGLNGYLREKFGCRVQKISVDAGLSCPNRDGTVSTGGCAYCNPRGSGTGAFSRGLSVRDQLIDGKAALSKRYKAKKFLAYFQSYTNTYAPFDRLKRIYEEALSVEDVVGLSIGTRPDCIDERILSLLSEYAKNSLVWVEYGLQTANDETLKKINRGHDFACFERAVKMTKGLGVEICAHVILGLPGETKGDMINTARELARLEIDGVKLHLLYVVENTALADLYKAGDYRCLSREQYVDIVCDFLELVPPGAVVQRLTGDPHPEELVAPQWALEKSRNLAAIREALEARDTWQGKLYSPERKGIEQ